MRVSSGWLLLFLLAPRFGFSADCNRNATEDLQDLASGASGDCNGNGIPDECDLLPPARFDAAESHRGSGEGTLLFDLDGDSDLDVALLGDSIEISRNLGGGGFSAPVPFTAGNWARAMAAGDIDLDGLEDLAVALVYGPSVAILGNHGDASLEPPLEFPTGDGPNGIALADLNLDGLLDVLTGGTQGVSVLLGDGPLGFSPPRLQGGAGFASALAVSDLDQDGDLDVVQCSAELEHLSVLYNESGELTAVQVAAPRGLNQSVAVDLDGSGVPDIAAATNEVGPELFIVKDHGGGPSPTIERVPIDFPARFIVAFDPDRDGDVDLAFAHSHQAHIHPNITVRFQEGYGSFTAASSYHFHSGTASRSLSSGDLDGDGLPDLVATSESFTVHWNGRTPLFGSTLAIRTDRDPRQMIADDFDEDGAPEALVLMGGSGTLQAFVVSDGSSSMRTVAVDVSYSGAVLEKHDVDSDFDVDIVQARGSDMTYWHNDGDGAFTRERVFRVEDVGEIRDFEIADLDDNGAPDLILVGGGNIFRIPSLVGQEISIEPQWLGGFGGTLSGIEVADLNGDEAHDLIVFDSGSNEIKPIWIVNGQLTPRAPVVGGVAPRSLLAIDLDLDGDVDVATANGGSDDVSVLANDGQGRLTFSDSLSTGAEPSFLAAGDFNADGYTDLATCNVRSDSVSVMMNEGSLQFRQAAELPVGEDPLELVAADMDLDGRDDLAVAGHTSGTLHIFLSKSDAAFESDCNANGSPDSCDISEGLAADLDLNGVPDSCEEHPFRRGDPNDDGITDLSDGVDLLLFLFADGSTPSCLDSADANADLEVDIADPVYVLGYLFLGGPIPPPPGPARPGEPCGKVAAGPGLGCEDYRSCTWAF
jgi:hypothetical protein